MGDTFSVPFILSCNNRWINGQNQVLVIVFCFFTSHCLRAHDLAMIYFFITYCCYKLYWQRKPRTSLTLQIIRVYSFAMHINDFCVKLFALIILFFFIFYLFIYLFLITFIQSTINNQKYLQTLRYLHSFTSHSNHSFNYKIRNVNNDLN